jgi:replicative DNA helicase
MRLSDPEREWDVLAAIIGESAFVPDVLRVVEAADFTDTDAALVFECVRTLWERGEAIDARLVADELARTWGKRALAARLFGAALPGASARSHAQQIRALAMLRRLRATGLEVSELATAESAPAEVIERGAELLRLAGEDVPGQDAGMPELVAETEADADSPAAAIPTGLPTLDRDLGGGLVGSRLYVLASRPGVGKSALATNIVRLTLDRGIPVLMCSLEMTGTEVLNRLVTDKYAITNGDLATKVEGWHSPEVTAWPLRFMGLANLTTLVAGVRRLRPQGLGLVVVDYLQLLPVAGRRFERRQQEVGHITRTLKLLAVETGVPILALSQLNRQPTARKDDPKPRLSDLRESGDLEQDANVVMLLHRDMDNPAKVNDAELLLAKNRHGATGVVELHFWPQLTRFRERSLRSA